VHILSGGSRGKAVADGAISFFLDHYLSVRVARTTLGINMSVLYDHGSQHHRRRFRDIVTTPAGTKLLRNGFKVILAKARIIPIYAVIIQAEGDLKGTRVSEKTPPFRYSLKADVPSGMNVPATVDIFAYRGDDSTPRWVDVESGACAAL
jgi:hypothetical protein